MALKTNSLKKYYLKENLNACRKRRKSIWGEQLWEIFLYKIFQPVLIAIFVSLLFQQSAEHPGVMYKTHPVKEIFTIYIPYMYANIYRNIYTQGLIYLPF